MVAIPHYSQLRVHAYLLRKVHWPMMVANIFSRAGADMLDQMRLAAVAVTSLTLCDTSLAKIQTATRITVWRLS
eukprot:8034382-Karenia_brevis.AAC.1